MIFHSKNNLSTPFNNHEYYEAHTSHNYRKKKKRALIIPYLLNALALFNNTVILENKPFVYVIKVGFEVPIMFTYLQTGDMDCSTLPKIF